jgi:hypothetical protein
MTLGNFNVKAGTEDVFKLSTGNVNSQAYYIS